MTGGALVTEPVSGDGRRVLFIIGGGIAAYKAVDAIRRLRERGVRVRAVMTPAATRFVTPLTVSALTGQPVRTELFASDAEAEVGHIRLARETDLVLVAPATADLMARHAHGIADDLATTILLATTAPVVMAPAMNPAMWMHPATRTNRQILAGRGVAFVGPASGAMAEPESGPGRLVEPTELASAVLDMLAATRPEPLAGLRALVTSGPTHEPIDPVRYIANRSSGKQGHAIAAALARAGAQTRLISGPTRLPDPAGVSVDHVESAEDMLAACRRALPVDIAVFAAAVADWRVAQPSEQKVKKTAGAVPTLTLVENPDILATLSQPGATRPRLVIGFAAETENVVAAATAKRARKGCDWIVANDVSPDTGTFGGDDNTVHLIRNDSAEAWPRASKNEVARQLVEAITAELAPVDQGSDHS